MVLPKALFLDRDGVVNVEKEYLYKVEDFELIDGIVDVCLKYQNQGYVIIIVTNQSGISRGYYSEEDFDRLSMWMVEYLAAFGVKIAHIYHCPHHESINGACECRKPNPGMLLQAQREFDLDMESSVMIGDNERDIEAAIAAGVKVSYLLSQSAQPTKATKIIHTLGELL
jgi:D-glycero-D-manno-heptose 1,7-bisphosphate phosphatase